MFNNENILNRNINLGKKKEILNKKSKSKKLKSNHPFRETWRKIHRWIGLIITIFVLNFAFSGIILNHREEVSFIDIPRNWMPLDYQYMNWNNASVKSILHSTKGTFIYGNIGIWKKNGKQFQDFNKGFPKGADNRNIHSMLETSNGNLYAGTLMGFYKFNNKIGEWQKVVLPSKEQRVVKLLEKDGIVYALTRSNIIAIKETSKSKVYDTIQIPEPSNYKKETSLFETLWQIHSGEVFGILGKLFMDFIGIVFIFLVISGLIKWYYPKTFKKIKESPKLLFKRKKVMKFNLKWHNKLGLWLGIILLISALTGIFLRPPLLILIAEENVGQIPMTNLDQDNPWFDKLRNITWSEESKKWIIATNESLYFVNENFHDNPVKINNHPPISVMGVNVLEQMETEGILVGSFAGLFLWYPKEGLVLDYVLKKPAESIVQSGPPIGAFAVSGYGFDENGKEYYFDYNMGAIPLNSNSFFTKMPTQIIENAKISLWNAMLEFHTARIFKALVNDFYILIVPLSGLLIAITVISGIIIWFWVYKGKNL